MVPPTTLDRFTAVPTGFEPATSTLTGWRSNQIALRDHIACAFKTNRTNHHHYHREQEQKCLGAASPSSHDV